MWQPFGQAPPNNTAYWQESPDGRGTYSILSSCVITLSLCAYTSLHLNIPEHSTTYWRYQIWWKMWWVVVGIATPEFLAFIAVRDFVFARNLESDIKNLKQSSASTTAPSPSKVHDVELGHSNTVEQYRGDKDILVSIDQIPNPPLDTRASMPDQVPKSRPILWHSESSFWHISSRRQLDWTRKHSYFAIMGGYALDTSKMLISVLEKGHTRGTLKVSALKNIIEHVPEVLPHISETAIKDKSKANGLAKCLVCLQATWFCVQLVGRLISDGCPISLLELNTGLHCLCCLCTYTAWWRKPLDIDQPELIDAAGEQSLTFYARLLLSIGSTCRRLGPDTLDDEVPEVSMIRGVHSDGPKVARAFQQHNTYAFNSHDVTEELQQTMQNMGDDKYQITLRLHMGQTCFGFHPATSPESTDDNTNHLYAELQWPDIECLRRADRLAIEEGTKLDSIWQDMFVDHASMIHAPGEDLKRFKRSATSSWDPDNVLWFFLMVAGAIYGGIHLLAWNGPFQTAQEQWLWRISGIIIASPVVIVTALYNAIAVLWSWHDDWPESKLKTRAGKVGDVALGMAILVFGLVYSAARVYVVVECFMNLAHLPPEVYQEPSWSRYIPHFSAG